jgi:flagellar assembly factor FliW
MLRAVRVECVFTNCFVIAESDEPKIGTFSVGHIDSLGLETENSDSKWFLVVRTAQDYELQTQQNYMFLVDIKGERQNVAITVVNVDDEYPVFLAKDSTPCIVSVSNPTSIALVMTEHNTNSRYWLQRQ